MFDLEICNIEFEEALLSYDQEKVCVIFEKFVLAKEAGTFIDQVIVPVLENIGKKWEIGETSLSQVYLSSKLCENFVEVILPAKDKVRNKKNKVIAIATLQDNHVLGKKIVTSVLKASGINFIDYGAGLTVKDLVDFVKNDKVEILLLSVLMYPSAIKIAELRSLLEQEKLLVKILVGGAPFNFDKELFKKVRADAMGMNAAQGVQVLTSWLEEEAE